MYNILEDEQPRILETKGTIDEHDSSDASMFEMSCSFLHRIAVRPKIIPYTDMVKWVIDEADISDIEFKTRSQEVMGSFTQDNLRLMYHLPESQVIYNKKFIEKFAKENEELTDCTRTWSNNEGKVKKYKNSMYSTASIWPLMVL